MRIIDRYIVKSIISIFFSTIVIFCLLYVLIDTASNLDDFIERKVPIPILLEYYLSYLPVILIQTSPIACLISALFTYSNLNSTNEIIVLRTSGLNFWQMAKPALMFSCIIAACMFFINERLVPDAEARSRKIKNESMILEVDTQRKKKAKIKNLTFYGLKNRLFFIDEFDPNDYSLSGITIVGFDENQNIREKIVSYKGEWTGIAWKFHKCQISSFQEANISDPIKVRVFPEKVMNIKETPRDFLTQRLNVSSMNIKQLHDYIDRFSKSGANKAINNLKVDLYQKYAHPAGTIVIVLLGLPLAMLTGRRKALTFTSLGIAIAIGFFYHVCSAVGLALGKGGFFPPLLSAWIAPLLFLLIGFYVIKVQFE